MHAYIYVIVLKHSSKIFCMQYTNVHSMCKLKQLQCAVVLVLHAVVLVLDWSNMRYII
jgi:hypothetical protein